MPDRDNRTELGVLSPDGTLRILARGSLDTRPISVNEHLAEQVREYQAKGYPIPDRILARLSKKDLSEPRLRPQGDVTSWAEAETVTAATTNLQLSAQSVLTTGRMSGGAADDLIVLDQSGSKVLVMPFELDYGKIDQQNTHLSFEGKRATQDFEADGSPVAALALKLNHDNKQDLLILKADSGVPTAIVSAPQATFTVTTAADNIDASPGSGICNAIGGGCTLRAAIMEANGLTGDDTIMINAGINPTISRGQPDNDGQGTNDQANGDLDITCVITNPASGGCNLPLAGNVNGLSIIGAAGGNTVSAGTFTAYPVNGGGTINTDRVFDIGQDGIFGGGAVFRDRGTLNFTNVIIGGTLAGEPNTANNGGVAHAFPVDSAAGNDSNQTIVTINGGSINGNIANTDGGVYFNTALFDTTASTLNIGQTTATALTGNKAKNNGGGIHTSSSATANLKDVVLRSNQADSDASGGGAGFTKMSARLISSEFSACRQVNRLPTFRLTANHLTAARHPDRK